MTLKIKSIKDFRIYTKDKNGKWIEAIYFDEIKPFTLITQVKPEEIRAGIGEYNDNRY